MKNDTKLRLIHGISGEVLIPDVAAERVGKIEAMRDRLDEMARAAREAGDESDAACLDAGSFALTYVLKESQQ